MADLELEIEKSEDTEMGNALSDAFDSVEADVSQDVSQPTETPEKPLAPVQTGLTGLDDKSGTEEKPPEPAPATDTPPHSWTPAERESWAAIPKNVQETIQRRESEIQRALSHSAGARNLAGEFEQVIAPYVSLMNANQMPPMQAVSNALQSYGSLMSGTPEVKARVIVDAIETYGVDINSLDAMLAGEDFVKPVDPMVEAMQQQLAPMRQFMARQEAQQSQQAQHRYQENSNHLQQFMQSNEFSNDLRNEMGDILEMHGKRGIELSLQEAYDKALLHRPDIQAVIQQREAGQQASQNNQSVAQKQNAASSIPQGQSPVGSPATPTDMRSALEAAYNE